MPSQITPEVTTISGVVDTKNSEQQTTLEELAEISERVHRQLELVTGLELEKGDM